MLKYLLYLPFMCYMVGLYAGLQVGLYNFIDIHFICATSGRNRHIYINAVEGNHQKSFALQKLYKNFKKFEQKGENEADCT